MAPAPTTVERTTRIASPAEVLFAVVMSPETAPLIDPAVRVWAADRRPIGVGTRFTIRGRLGWVPIRARSEVVTWDPPTLAEFESLTVRWPFRLVARHRFVPAREGEATDYTWSVTFEPVSAVARPVVPFAARLFERALGAQAETLAAHVATMSEDDLPPL